MNLHVIYAAVSKWRPYPFISHNKAVPDDCGRTNVETTYDYVGDINCTIKVKFIFMLWTSPLKMVTNLNNSRFYKGLL